MNLTQEIKNVCETCTNYTLPSNPCLGVRGFDGYYTWGTPIYQEDVDTYPSDVMDTAQPPHTVGDCIGYEAKKK